MIRRIGAMILGLAVLASPVLAAGDDPVLDFGKSTYKQFCSHCHGLDMVNPGTSSYDLRKFPQDGRERFFQSVLKGKGDMPAWGDILLPKEMDALWHYVQTRGGKEPEAAGAPAAEPQGKAALELLEEGRLTACLARNGGVMSSRRSGGGVGFDYELSVALAEALGLELSVIWYESEAEEETTPVKDSYALLAHGLCDIAPGFALYAPALDRYPGTRAPLPRWDGRPDWMAPGFHVDLQPIAVSDPYIRMEIGIVVRDGIDVGPVRSIRDLDGLKMGIEQGTLPGVLTLRQGTEAMVRDGATFSPGPGFLWKMENGAFDAALLTVGMFDFHKRQNPVTKLRLLDWRHSLGFNLGVAMLEGKPALLAAVNGAIGGLAAEGAFPGLAGKALLHYAAPREPFVQARLTMRDIVAGN